MTELTVAIENIDSLDKVLPTPLCFFALVESKFFRFFHKKKAPIPPTITIMTIIMTEIMVIPNDPLSSPDDSPSERI